MIGGKGLRLWVQGIRVHLRGDATQRLEMACRGCGGGGKGGGGCDGQGAPWYTQRHVRLA